MEQKMSTTTNCWEKGRFLEKIEEYKQRAMPLRAGNYLLVVAGPYSRAKQVINIRFYNSNIVLFILYVIKF